MIRADDLIDRRVDVPGFTRIGARAFAGQHSGILQDIPHPVAVQRERVNMKVASHPLASEPSAPQAQLKPEGKRFPRSRGVTTSSTAPGAGSVSSQE